MAETLFETRGLDVPLRDVAAAAGVSQASLFKHFSSRADLTCAVRDRVYCCMEKEIQANKASPSDVRANVEAVLYVHARLAKERPSIFSLAFPSTAHMAQLAAARAGHGRALLPGLARLQAALPAGPGYNPPASHLASLSSWFTVYGMALTFALEFGRDRLKAEEGLSTLLDLLTSQMSGLG